MSRKYKIRDQSALYFVMFTVILGWMFLQEGNIDIFLDSIRYCQANKAVTTPIGAMTNFKIVPIAIKYSCPYCLALFLQNLLVR
jgi:hypothetical protein